MGSNGVIQLYERSFDKHNVRYNAFIGDGDSSSYSSVDKFMPYRPMYNIEKSECVNTSPNVLGQILDRYFTNIKVCINPFVIWELEEPW